MTRPSQAKSEKKAPESKDYYLRIIDSLPNLVYLLDKNCSLAGCNRNFLNLLNVEKGKALGHPPYKHLTWSNERVELLKRDDINALLAEEPIINLRESPVVEPKGGITYYQSSRTPLYNKEKEVIGLLCIFTDVTAQKKMAEELELLKEKFDSLNAKKESEAVKTAQSTNTYLGKVPKVLMVEDNSIAQKAAQALLMQLDCHVDVADSGDKALKKFEPGKYDLVFMDIGLEDTSGYIVSKRIRQLEKGTQFHVPIIALTGYEAEVVKYDCDEYTMEGALTKPLTSEQAQQIIQHYIYHIDIPVSGLKTLKG